MPQLRRDGKQHFPTRVLIVDDNLDLAWSMSMLLLHYGFAVATAPNGRSAIEQARHFQPTIILLDIGLPDMNGYEIADALRGCIGLEQATYIAVSAMDAMATGGQPSPARFDHYLIKPVDLERLLPLLNQAGG